MNFLILKSIMRCFTFHTLYFCFLHVILLQPVHHRDKQDKLSGQFRTVTVFGFSLKEENSAKKDLD